jgi:hypothetical protein
MEVSGQLHATAALTPGKKPQVAIGNEAGWAPEPVWTTWRREHSCPYRDSNWDLSVVQPVALRYTDWAIPARPQIIRSVGVTKNNPIGAKSFLKTEYSLT